MEETTVVLGVGDPGLQEALLRRLEAVPGVRVAAAHSEPEVIARAVRRVSPDVAVVSADALIRNPGLGGVDLVVVEERETTAALRSALRAGAHGFFLWPEERDELVARIVRTSWGKETPPSESRVVGVFGARGGAGATFLATHLAAACARGSSVVLADLDFHFAGVTTALGLSTNGEAATISDVDTGSPDPGDLGTVLQPHPRGFAVLQAPVHPPTDGGVDAATVRGLVSCLREAGNLVFLHLPRSLDPCTLAAMESSDRMLMVVTLDVLAFRDAARVVQVLRRHDLVERCRLVINRARRSDVVPDDAEQVFGLIPFATIPVDPGVPRAQDRGELLADSRSRAARRITQLAQRLLEEKGS